MILFHGSNILVEKVDLLKCRPYKDFGRGFYCTTILEQAQLMAKRVSKIFGGDTIVSSFEYEESLLVGNSLNIKEFAQPSEEWARFVMNNRNREFNDVASLGSNFDNKYDIVIGPVANDDLAILFRNYVNGIIDFQSLVKGMKFKQLTNQHSFHTEKALQFLKNKGGVKDECG